MRAPEFEALIRPARLYPQVWRLLLGLFIVAFTYLGALALEVAALFAALGPFEFGAMLPRLRAPVEAVPTLLLLASFIGLFFGPMLAAAACQGRGPQTLFGPFDETLRGFLVALAVAVPLYGALTALGSAFEPMVANLPIADWLGWLPFALPLILVQVTSEELLFRGYLQQQLAARFASRFVWMYLPAIVFAALHWNPEAGYANSLTMLATFVFAVIAADLTERTGSLGAAIGLHFVNNLTGLTLVSMPGTITGLALWTTPFGLESTAQVSIALAVNIIFLAVVWRLLRWALDR